MNAEIHPPRIADDPPLSGFRLFLIGLGLMLIWPVICAAVHPFDEGLEFYLIYLIGLFTLLFGESIEEMIGQLATHSEFWITPAVYTIVGVMILAWIAILCLPFFGSWNRRRAVLWILQSIYSASQAFSGLFFAYSRTV